MLREQGGFRKRRLRYRQGYNRCIEPAFGQFLEKARRQGFANMDVQLGITVREVPDDAWQEIRRDSWDHAYAQATAQEIPRGSGEISQFLHRAQDGANSIRSFLAEACQSHLSWAALEQCRT